MKDYISKLNQYEELLSSTIDDVYYYADLAVRYNNPETMAREMKRILQTIDTFKREREKLFPATV